MVVQIPVGVRRTSELGPRLGLSVLPDCFNRRYRYTHHRSYGSLLDDMLIGSAQRDPLMSPYLPPMTLELSPELLLALQWYRTSRAAYFNDSSDVSLSAGLAATMLKLRRSWRE